jgi:protein-tyrosine phosphatase
LTAFQDLEWKQRFRLQHAFNHPESSRFRLDRSPLVISRNRYGNVQPWDSARVKLKKPLGGSDYVNASPITLEGRTPNNKSRSGASTPASLNQASQVEAKATVYKYVASQGPKEGQFCLFWHMVMQETTGDVGVIVMLTQLYENHKEKCALYYPTSMDNPTMILPAHEDEYSERETETADDGDPFLDPPMMSADTDSAGTDSDVDTPPVDHQNQAGTMHGQCGTVTLLSVTYDAKIGCDVRKLKLTIDGESKEIYHYLFHGWPDFGKPEGEDRRALMELCKVSRKVAGDSPRIIHCSAGVGRTGTFIVMDFLLHELQAGRLVDASPPSDETTLKSPSTTSNGTWGKSGPPKPSTPEIQDEDDVIYETVNKLREQRMMMVMNELQYTFLYEALRDVFYERYTEKETGPIVTEVQEPSPKVARKKSPFGGMYHGSRVGTAKGEEDTVSEVGLESEAETEIMDKDEADVDAQGEKDRDQGDVDDPYSAVAPETIRRGQRKEKQGEVRDHEVQ